MNTLFIQLLPPGYRFSFFYSLAFVVALMGLLYEGHKRKFPMLQWILIVSFSQILFIIGTKLFALSPGEWSTMFQNLVLVPTGKKELFGGIFMLGAGLWIGKKWMHFKPGILDPFAIVLPLSLMIQKAGCFFAGCCFGRPCELPWAVQYPVDTLPHYHHYIQSLISQGEVYSLPVHPAQLYELLGALGVVCLVVACRRKWNRSGSQFLFSASLYLIVRFTVEFFKDPLAHTTGGKMIGLMNQTQWGILILLPILVFLLLNRESKQPLTPAKSPVTGDRMPAPAISLLTLSALILILLSGWFRKIEMAMILLFFVLTAVLTLRYILVNYRKARIRLVYVCFLVLPFLLMGQKLPRQVSDSVRVRKSKSARIGFATGNFDNSFETYQGEGCDRIGKKGYFNQKYNLAGAGFNFRNENITREYETSYGLNLTFGSHDERMLKLDSYPYDSISSAYVNPEWKNRAFFDINPYVKFDTRWFGMGVGFHAGKLSLTYVDREKEDYKIPHSGRMLVSFYPQLNLRIGPRDIGFLSYRMADDFPSALPGYRNMIGIGSGFGSGNGVSLQLGTQIAGKTYQGLIFQFSEIHFKGFYLYGSIPIKNRFILEPMFYSMDSPFDQKYQLQFSLALLYNWGMNTITLPAPGLK